jgi:putative nucleotidyltransferase with HDIG domain
VPPLDLLDTNQNLVRLFGVLKTIVDLGPAASADRDFSETAADVLHRTMLALEARQGALFVFEASGAAVTCLAATGFDSMHARIQLAVTRQQQEHWHSIKQAAFVGRDTIRYFFTTQTEHSGFAGDLQCVMPLRMGQALVGVLCLGVREHNLPYTDSEREALGLLAGHLAMLVQNHTLVLSLRNQISDNLRLLTSLDHSFDDALDAFATTIDAKDKHMRGHSMRVGKYAAAIAGSMGFAESEVSSLRAAGQLHDIGKVTVDKSISAKTSTLRPEEFREMADHTVIGHQIVSSVRFPWPQVPEVVRWHHERTDGSGYPDNLRQDEIPLPARIVAVADTFDAMTSERPYRKPRTAMDAAEELVRLAPEKFDPSVVQGLLVQLRWNFQGARPRQSAPVDNLHISAMELDKLSMSLMSKMTNHRVYSA